MHVAVADDRLSARATDDVSNCLHLRQRALSSILRFHKQSPSISQPLAELQTRTDAKLDYFLARPRSRENSDYTPYNTNNFEEPQGYVWEKGRITKS